MTARQDDLITSYGIFRKHQLPQPRGGHPREKRVDHMQQKFGLIFPRTLEEICEPSRLALLVYDMQVGVVSQIRNGPEITSRVLPFCRPPVKEDSVCSSTAT